MTDGDGGSRTDKAEDEEAKGSERLDRQPLPTDPMWQRLCRSGCHDKPPDDPRKPTEAHKDSPDALSARRCTKARGRVSRSLPCTRSPSRPEDRVCWSPCWQALRSGQDHGGWRLMASTQRPVAELYLQRRSDKKRKEKKARRERGSKEKRGTNRQTNSLHPLHLTDTTDTTNPSPTSPQQRLAPNATLHIISPHPVLHLRFHLPDTDGHNADPSLT